MFLATATAGGLSIATQTAPGFQRNSVRRGVLNGLAQWLDEADGAIHAVVSGSFGAFTAAVGRVGITVQHRHRLRRMGTSRNAPCSL